MVTHEVNKPYYEKAWATPRTLAPDTMSQSGKTATFETFGDKHTNDGFLYGAGLETFLGNNASIRVEYSATDYGHFEDGAAGVINNKVSAGFGWHF